MDYHKLGKLIKIVVGEEIKKQKQQLKKEMISLVSKQVKKERKQIEEQIKKEMVASQDPFELADKVLENERKNEPKLKKQLDQKFFSKDPMLNEILNETERFGKNHYDTDGGGGLFTGEDVMINEVSRSPFENEVDERTIEMNSNNMNAQQGDDVIKSSFKNEMEQESQPTGVSETPKKQGLGVKTGLAGLDRILNRDNSELVKRFKR